MTVTIFNDISHFLFTVIFFNLWMVVKEKCNCEDKLHKKRLIIYRQPNLIYFWKKDSNNFQR